MKMKTKQRIFFQIIAYSELRFCCCADSINSNVAKPSNFELMNREIIKNWKYLIVFPRTKNYKMNLKTRIV